MINKILNKFYVTSLNEFISESERITQKYKKEDLLTDSYNVGQIVHNITRDLCENYKIFIKKKLKVIIIVFICIYTIKLILIVW